MEIVLIIIAVFVVALFSVGVTYAISIYKQRAQQKEEFQRSQKQTKPSSRSVVHQIQRPLQTETVKAGGSSSSNSHYLHDPMIAVAIASSDMSSSSSYSGGGYSGGSSCSGGDSSSSGSSDSSSSSCD